MTTTHRGQTTPRPAGRRGASPDTTPPPRPMAAQPGRRRGTARALAVAAALALLLVGCGADGALEVRDARSRMSPMLTGVGAVYLDIENGTDTEEELLGGAVDASVAAEVEIHETFDADPDGQSDGAMGDGDGMDDDQAMGDGDGAMGDGDGMDDDQAMGDGDDAMDGDAGGMEPTPEGFAMMGMREVDALIIPAGETVELVPGGHHLMLLDLADDLVPGDSFELTLTFLRAGDVTVTVEVREDIER